MRVLFSFFFPIFGRTLGFLIPTKYLILCNRQSFMMNSNFRVEFLIVKVDFLYSEILF